MAKIKRIFVDTNVFLRSVLDDNEDQAKTVKTIFGSAVLNQSELVTTVIVFFEVAWVLKSYYKVLKEDLKKVLLDLLILKTSFEGKKVFKKSVKNMEKFNYDLEDAYNFYSAQELGVDDFLTFDKKLVLKYKKSPMMED